MTLAPKKSRLKKPQPLLYFSLVLVTLLCLLPLVLIVIVSFSAEESIIAKGFSFFPTAWSMEGWSYVWKYRGQVLMSYRITIYETVVGTALMILLNSMFAYGLSRKNWVMHKFLTIFILITMLFSGGMVATYLVKVNYLHLKNNLLVLVLPAMSTSNIIIFRTYITTNVPDSLIEAAKIDGAGDIYLYFRVVFPLMLPSCAALGFMSAVGHWNEWQTAMLYINDPNKATLQLMLQKIEKELEYLLNCRDCTSCAQADQLRYLSPERRHTCR